MYEQPKQKAERTASVVSLLIRLTLAVIFGVAAGGKIVSIVEGGYWSWVGGFVNSFENSFLYMWPFRALLYVFSALLPWFETSIALTLFAGFKTRIMLLVCAFVLGFLTFGMLLQKNGAVAANNSQYVLYAAIAYYFATLGNRYSLDAVLAKNGQP
jgi:uncharacterized membrane protein YphA (DoxX/SURF4 family)